MISLALHNPLKNILVQHKAPYIVFSSRDKHSARQHHTFGGALGRQPAFKDLESEFLNQPHITETHCAEIQVQKTSPDGFS